MKRTKKLTRRQIKNAPILLNDLQNQENLSRRKLNLLRALKKEVTKQEAKLPVSKPRVINPLFSLTKYLELSAQKKHDKKHFREHRRAEKQEKK